jgi:translocation and assembly module TamB
MKRAFRILLRCVLGLTAVLALGVAVLIGALWWVGPDTVLDRVRSELLDLINTELSGSFTVERIDGSLGRDLQLHDVTISMAGKPVLSAARVRAHYALDLSELLRGVIRIDSIEVEAPRLHARVDAEGEIDFFEVFVPRKSDDKGSPVTVLIDRLHFVGGDLRVDGVGPRQLRLGDLAAELSLEIPRHGLTVTVPRAAGKLTGLGERPIALAAAVRFAERDERGTLEIGPVDIDTGASRLSASAVLHDLGKHGEALRIEARVEAAPLAARDLRALLDEWPLAEGISGTVSAAGNLDSLPFAGNVRLAGSNLPVAGNLALRGPDPRYDASVEVADLALEALADELPLTGRLSGSGHVAGSFEHPQDIAVDIIAGVTDLQVDGHAFGELRADARLLDREARLHAEVDGPSGKAGVYANGVLAAGQTNLTGDAFLADFDLVRFLDLAGLPRSAVNATARLQIDAADDSLAAATTLYAGPSRLGSIPIDTGVVRLDFRDTTLRIEEANLASGTTRFATQGYLVLDSASGSRLDASLTVPRLVLADDDDRIAGAGRIEATATLRGLLRSPRLRLHASGADLRSDDVEIADFEADADVGIDTAGHATGTAQLRVGEVSGPFELAGSVIDVELGATATTQEMELELAVDDRERGAHRLQLTGSIGPEEARFRAESLRLGTRHGEWMLAAPATLTHDRRGWTLSPLRIASGERIVEAGGTVPAKGELDVSARAEGIDLAFLFGAFERTEDISGVLQATLEASGTVGAPRAGLRVAIDDLMIAGTRQAPVTFDASLSDGTIAAELAFDPEGDGWLRAQATLPVDVRIDTPAASRVRGPIDGRIEIESLPLELLRPLAGSELRRIVGTMAADVEFSGDVSAPEIRGRFGVLGGGARIHRLKVDVEDLTVDAMLDSDVLRITTASARSGKGRIDVAGAVALRGLAPASFDMELRARRWPVINTKAYQAQIGATLRLDGPIEAPELKGEVVIQNANIKPDLEFLDSGGGPRELDATIAVIDTGRPSLPSDAAARAEQVAPLPGLPERIRGDVKLIIESGTRVRHSMADVDLTGELRIRKDSGDEPVVTGRIQSRRGTIEIQGSEFKLERAVVTFTGGDIDNPRLDVVAIHRRSPYEIEARIGGSVKEPTLTFASDPPMDQADILSVLLFGKPTTDLDEGEQSTLQQEALSLTSGFAAAVLSKAVTESLGLDRFGLDLSNVSFTGGSVGFGRYLTTNAYVSVTQHLDEDQGREATIEYFFTPRWKIVSSTDSLGASGVDIIWQALY